LQLLPPTHFTFAWLEFPDESCADTGALKNIALTAAAKTAPANVFLFMILLLRVNQPVCTDPLVEALL
jgi:hypothetical protein